MLGPIAKLGARIAIITVLGAVVMVANSVRGVVPGITFAGCCGLDLKVDSSAFYNGLPMPNLSWELKDLLPHVDKFFNFSDIKPGDSGRTIMSLHVNKDAWLCLDFMNLKDLENTINEPESLEDVDGVLSGELADGMEFFGWFDDGDTTFEIGEIPLFGTSTQSASTTLKHMSYVIADAGSGSPLVASTTRYVGIAWCAGDLQVNLSTAVIGCDGTALGNEAQTDSMQIDLTLRVLPSADNTRFKCKRERPPHNDNECSIYDDPYHTGDERPDEDDRDDDRDDEDDRTRTRTSSTISLPTTTITAPSVTTTRTRR
ncbi:MAG: hypothetical protein AAB343_03705 [Patescibacteria group bacterium]